MSLNQSKVGNIYIGDQIVFRQGKGEVQGIITGFGYTTANGIFQPYLKIFEYPGNKILIPQVEKIVNRGKRNVRN